MLRRIEERSGREMWPPLQ